VILFRSFRCKGTWCVIVVGNWSSYVLIVSALASSVKLAILSIYLFMSRHEVHSMNTHTLQNAGWYKNRQYRT